MAEEVIIFGIHLNINPIAFKLPIGNGFYIYWYGILIATGFALALVYATFNAKRFNLDRDRLLDAVLVATPTAILSARLYYILFNSDSSIKEFFNFTDRGFQGLAIYGAVIGAVVGGGIMCYIRKINILDAFDLTAIGFLIGQSVGRWGNFVNQEAFGCATGSDFFGMTSPSVEMELGKGVLAHPCFLYESIWCLIGFILLHLISKKRKYSGQIMLSYGAWYGFGRGFIELLRTDSLYIGSLKVSCLLSFVICAVSVILLIVFNGKNKYRDNDTENYVPIFDGVKENEDN